MWRRKPSLLLKYSKAPLGFVKIQDLEAKVLGHNHFLWSLSERGAKTQKREYFAAFFVPNV